MVNVPVGSTYSVHVRIRAELPEVRCTHRALSPPAVPAITSNRGKCSFLKDTFNQGVHLLDCLCFRRQALPSCSVKQI